MKMMLLLNKAKQNYQRQDAKDYIEIGIQAFKLLFYASITGGIIWNLLYFGCVVKSLPKLGVSDIPIYLISIFGTGLFFIILVVICFILPGWIYYQRRSKTVRHHDGNGLQPHPIGYFYIGISLIFTIWLCAEIKLVKTVFILISIIPAIAIGGALYIVGEFYKHGENKIADLMDKFNIPNKAVICAGLVSIIFFIIPVSFALGISIGVANATNDEIEAISIFALTLIFAISVNAVVAEKGFNFYAFSQNRFLNAITAFLLISVVVIAYLSILIKAENNPFLKLPYRQLKLGSFYARLAIDEKYMQSHLKTIQIKKYNNTKSENSEQLLARPCFFVLSSIGEYFIVKFADNEKCEIQNPKSNKDDMKKVDSKNSNRNNQLGADNNYIFRIPTDKVLLVEYIEKMK